MAAPALVVDKQAVFDASLNGLLGGLHHLCKQTQAQEAAPRSALRGTLQRGPSTQSCVLSPEKATSYSPSNPSQKGLETWDPAQEIEGRGTGTSMGALTQGASAELAGLLVHQHFLHHVQ